LIEVLAVLAVWFYSFMTGFGPSVQRAAGMISLFAISRLLGRKVQPMQVLVLAFLFQLAINPFAIFSFGFQLSYLAVAGIFVVYRPWTRLINSSKLLVKKVWDFAGVSIAAQTFTLPFILIYFHEFPVYFLLGNLLLVPLGLIVFYLGIGYILILSSGLSINLLAQVLDKMVSLLLSIGKGIAGFPLCMINFDSFSILNLMLYYLIIAILFKAKRLSLYKRLVYIVIFTIGLKIISLILGI
jgi:competence protein ComEC